MTRLRLKTRRHPIERGKRKRQRACPTAPRRAYPIVEFHRALVVLATVCALAGCASFSSIMPGDSAATVKERVGPPTTVWKQPDGSQLWQYPTGPYGAQTFMITIGPDEAVRELHQSLSEEYLSQAQPGMSREDVYKLLGRPGEVKYFASRDEETWLWRYREAYYMYFIVLFDRTKGTVRTTLRLPEMLFLGGRH